MSMQACHQIGKQSVWNFNYGVFCSQRIAVFIQQIQQSCVQQAYLGVNQNLNIPKLVCHINFPFLRILNLQTNHIKNIEVLEYFKVIELKQLNLKNNQITNLRILKKLKWLKLQSLIIQKNLCTDIHPISLAGFRRLQNLNMENSTDQKICENINILTKLNTNSIKNINCSSKKRIIDIYLFKQMKQKNKQIVEDNAVELVFIHKKKYN